MMWQQLRYTVKGVVTSPNDDFSSCGLEIVVLLLLDPLNDIVTYILAKIITHKFVNLILDFLHLLQFAQSGLETRTQLKRVLSKNLIHRRRLRVFYLIRRRRVFAPYSSSSCLASKPLSSSSCLAPYSSSFSSCLASDSSSSSSCLASDSSSSSSCLEYTIFYTNSYSDFTMYNVNF